MGTDNIFSSRLKLVVDCSEVSVSLKIEIRTIAHLSAQEVRIPSLIPTFSTINRRDEFFVNFCDNLKSQEKLRS